jgi:hypothetical protein
MTNVHKFQPRKPAEKSRLGSSSREDRRNTAGRIDPQAGPLDRQKRSAIAVMVGVAVLIGVSMLLPYLGS